MIRYSYLLSNDIYTHGVRDSATLWDILLEEGAYSISVTSYLTRAQFPDLRKRQTAMAPAKHTRKSEEHFATGKHKTLESAVEKWLDFAVIIFRFPMYWRNQ